MKTLTISLTKLSILSAIMPSAFAFNYLLAWDGPTGVAPVDNVDAPLNAGSTDQEKTGGVKAGSFWATGAIQTDARTYYFGDAAGYQSLVGNGTTRLQWFSNHDTITDMAFYDKQGTRYGHVYGGGDGSYFGLLDGDGNWSYFAEKDTKTEFRINNDTKMTILSDGKVGIGTNAPESKLQVDGDLSIKGSKPAVLFKDTDTGERHWQLLVNGSNMVFRMDRNGDKQFTSDDNPVPLILNAGDWNVSKEDDFASFANDVIIGGQLKMNFEERLYLSRFEDTAGNNNMIWADNNSGYNVNIASRGKHVLVGDTNATAADAAFIFGKKTKPGYDYSNNFTQLFNVNSSGLARSLGGWGSLSDARAKTNVAPLTDSLAKIEALNGVTFDWKDAENHPQVHDFGLIAQEVQEVLPEVVYQDDEDMDGMLTVDYGRIAAVLIEAVKELSEKNESLEARIAELEARSE